MAIEKINADDTLNQGRIKINNALENISNGNLIENYSIEKTKLKFGLPKFSKGNNLVGFENSTFGKYISYSDGTEVAKENYGYVEIALPDGFDNNKITIVNTSEQGAYYDANGNYIDGYQFVGYMNIPSNAKKIKQTFKISQYEDLIISLNPTLDEKYLISENSISDHSISSIKISNKILFDPEFNAIDLNRNTLNAIVKYYDGKIGSPASGYEATDYVRLDKRYKWEIVGTTEQLAFYDLNKKYVSGYTSASQLKKNGIPEKAEYIRMTLKTSQREAVVLRPIQKINAEWITQESASKVADFLSVKRKLIKVKDNGGDFSTLRAALENAKELDVIQIYKNINLTDEFSESEIKDVKFDGYKLKDKITIRGATGKEYISCDLPSEVYSDDDITRVATITIGGSGKLENLVVVGKSCRYAFHPETSGDSIECTDVHFKKIGGKFCQAVAGGLRSGQNHKYNRCTFETEWTGSGDIPFSYHSNVNFDTSCILEVENCKFVTNGSEMDLRFGGMASKVRNKLVITSCRIKGVYLKEELGLGTSGIDVDLIAQNNSEFKLKISNNGNVQPNIDILGSYTQV